MNVEISVDKQNTYVEYFPGFQPEHSSAVIPRILYEVYLCAACILPFCITQQTNKTRWRQL
jgi:hypothetical protein